MSRPGWLPSMVALMLAASVSGCYTDPESEPSIGQVERNETVTASNLAIVSDGEGNAVLVGTLVNNGEVEDQLVDVDVESESGPVEVTLVEGPIDLPVQEPVRLAEPPRVTLDSAELRQGFRAPLELTFESSAGISTTVTVEPHTSPYEDIEIPD